MKLCQEKNDSLSKNKSVAGQAQAIEESKPKQIGELKLK